MLWGTASSARNDRRIKRKLYQAILDLDGPAIVRECKRLGLDKAFPRSGAKAFWGGVHKARATLDMATPEQRQESLDWLRQAGMGPYGTTLN